MSDASHETVLAELLKIRDRATAFCFVVLRDFQAAEDAYQEAAMTVVRRIGEYTGAGFEKWFWTIQRNVLGTRIRSSRRSPIQVGSDLVQRLEALSSEPTVSSAEENVNDLMKCLERLPERSRALLNLRFMENLPCAEIAQRLGRSLESTYALIKRLRQQVRECVQARAQSAHPAG